MRGLSPENNFIKDAENFINNIKNLGPNFQDAYNKVKDALAAAQKFPVVGDMINTASSMVELISNIVKVWLCGASPEAPPPS